MITDAQLLTGPTTLATCNSDLSLTAKSLLSSSFIFLQVSPDTKGEVRMAAPQARPRNQRGINDGNELWFNMPSSRRHQNQHVYHATTDRQYATRSVAASSTPVPIISTTAELEKPLPPPSALQKKKHKPSFLNLRKKNPTDGLDPGHLQPEPSNGNLSPGLYHNKYQSRSMPNSPLPYSPPHSADMQRAHSSASHFASAPQYQAYSPPRPQMSERQRSVSMGDDFEPSPPTTRRTFPDSTTISTATPRESVSEAPRPYTWVSPTETFRDTTDFHLFAEATAGLPGGFDPLSPTMETPRLQGSLFARGSRNDSIPVLVRHVSTQSVPVAEVPQYEWSPQSPPDFSISSSALPRHDSYDISPPSSPRMPNLNNINLELERLGLADNNERPPDDELPDYQQSQAEMAAIKQKAASARARELESQWNRSRSWRNR